MAAFQTLLRRFTERPSFIDESQELELFRGRDAPSLDRAWRAWTLAERALARRDPETALVWLDEAESAETDDPVVQTEILSARTECWIWLDEPRQALGPARRAWGAWVKVAERARPESICPSVRPLLAVLSDPDPSPELSDEELFWAWFRDRFSLQFDRALSRLLSLYADFRDIESAKALSDQYLELVERGARAGFGEVSEIAIAQHLITMGDVYDRCGDSAKALEACQMALTKLAAAPEQDEIVAMRAQLNFNAANQLSKLERQEEALESFQEAERDLKKVGSEEAILRVRYAIAFVSHLLGRGDDLVGQLFDLARSYEKAWRDAATAPAQIAAWGMCNKVYRLWTRLSAESLDTNDALATTTFFHQLLALKEWEVKLTGFWERVREQPDADVHSEISVMMDRLDQRSDASLLIIEQAHEALIVAAVGAGPGRWNGRVSVQVIHGDDTAAFTDLIRLQRQAVHDLVDGLIPRDAPPSEDFLLACRHAWDALDEQLRRRIESADTVIVTIDNQTDLDQLPVELFHDGETFLGLRRNVVRVPSLTELNVLLCENSLNAAANGAALIVRAEGELPVADIEVRTVTGRLTGAGLEVETLREPTPSALLTRLGAGLDVLHYVGHGLADEVGEQLPLGHDAALNARGLDSVGPAPAPVTMLSGCLTGRSRQLRTGHLQGFVPALIRNGSPGVIAAKYLVGEEFVAEFSDLLYELWQGSSLPDAVRQTRRILAEDGYHPAVWCSYVVFGSPDVPPLGPHEREARTWPSVVMRYLASGSDRDYAKALELLRADSRLSDDSRQSVARDLEALAAGDSGYFREGILQEERGLGDFSEAMLASNMVRAFGVLRHGDDKSGAEDGLIEHILTCQRILGDAYVLVAAAAEMRRRTFLHLERRGKAVMNEARRKLRWLSADKARLASVETALAIKGGDT